MIRAPVSGKVNPMLIHRHAIAITAGLALAAAMCSGAPAATNRAPPSGLGIKRAQPPLPDVPIARYLGENLPRYRKAVDRARAWLDRLEVDPVALRAAGFKGKKKLVEILDAYLGLLRADPEGPGRDAMLERIAGLAEPAWTAAYHDMETADDTQFKQDSTSYLRAAYLLDRAGFDTGYYLAHILRILPRLNSHMALRGTDQRMAFHTYYSHFRLQEPFPLAAAFQSGLIAARASPEQIGRGAVYQFTHEIFVPYEFGEKLDAQFFSGDDLAYLREVLPILVNDAIARQDPDVAAELSSCMSYLQFASLPAYRDSLEYLLESQRPDGTWGDYERFRPTLGRHVDQVLSLHTLLVALDALHSAFAGANTESGGGICRDGSD